MACLACVFPGYAGVDSKSFEQMYEPLDAIRVPSTRYDVVSMIQEGSTATVHLAYDSVTKRNVAIKQYDVQNVNLSLLDREFSVQKALSSHPNIAKVYEFNSDRMAGEAQLVMEYCAGGDLIDQITPDVGMEPAQALVYALQVADALRFMHSKGYVHRDIKSENVCIDKSGVAKLIDFGVAQHVDAPVTLKMAGTLPYLGPEHCPATLYMPGKMDLKATDVWALGIMIWSSLTGRFPWRHASVRCPEFNRYSSNTLNSKETQLWGRIPCTLRSLLRDMLAVQPSARPTLDQVYARLAEIAMSASMAQAA